MADHKTDTMKGRKAKSEWQINDNAVKNVSEFVAKDVDKRQLC